jgi:hypothetical protein
VRQPLGDRIGGPATPVHVVGTADTVRRRELTSRCWPPATASSCEAAEGPELSLAVPSNIGAAATGGAAVTVAPRHAALVRGDGGRRPWR